jgi:hypothetical protein
MTAAMHDAVTNPGARPPRPTQPVVPQVDDVVPVGGTVDDVAAGGSTIVDDAVPTGAQPIELDSTVIDPQTGIRYSIDDHGIAIARPGRTRQVTPDESTAVPQEFGRETSMPRFSPSRMRGEYEPWVRDDYYDPALHGG